MIPYIKDSEAPEFSSEKERVFNNLSINVFFVRAVLQGLINR